MSAALFQTLHNFLVLFGMVNAVGNLPIFSDLTAGMDRSTRRRTFLKAALTACSIVIAFALLGDWMLRLVFEVDIAAFKVAGGLLVFAVAGRGVLSGPPSTPKDQHQIASGPAVFPLGFPFLAGPGTIITTILLMQSDGAVFTAFVGLLVYAAVLPVLFLAPLVERALGRVAVLVVSRILYIFIAAKAASFVIQGLKALWLGAK